VTKDKAGEEASAKEDGDDDVDDNNGQWANNESGFQVVLAVVGKGGKASSKLV